MRILFVEDDINLSAAISEQLQKEGYITDCCYDGETALSYALNFEYSYDIILLDRMLPIIDGLTVLKAMRSKQIHTPVLIITGLGELDDKIHGLDCGADDYLVKPFHVKELLARIEVQLRQKYKSDSMEPLKYKELELLLDNHTLLVHNQKVNLTKTEYAIIKNLLLNRNQVMTKNKLLESISMDTEDCDENSLRVHISNLRKKIRDYTENEYIESIWGIGFKIKE